VTGIYNGYPCYYSAKLARFARNARPASTLTCQSQRQKMALSSQLLKCATFLIATFRGRLVGCGYGALLIRLSPTRRMTNCAVELFGIGRPS